MTEIYINDRLIDLKDDEEIAQSFAVNSFGDISTRNSAYSNTFKIPFTANNKSILENAEIVLNNTRVPYSNLLCRIFIDGIMVVNGFAELTACIGEYEIRVYGGNFDFYSQIKSRNIQDLDLSDLNHNWTIEIVHASRVNTEGYIYPIIDYTVDSPNDYINNTDRIIDLRNFYFAIFLHTIISRIISEAGFTITGDLLSNPNYLSLAVPFSNDKLLINNPDRYLYKAGISASQTFLGIGAVDTLAVFDDDTSEGLYDNGNNWDTTLSRFVADEDVSVSFSLTINYTNVIIIDPFAPFISIRLRKNGFIVGGALLAISGQPVDFPSLSLITGDYVDFTYRATNGNEYTINVSGTATYNSINPNVQLYSNIDVAFNLPNIKQGDLLKAVLQKFGAIIQVNNETKEIQIRQFAEIIDNIPNAKDWSDKIDDTEKTELTFKWDRYGQINKSTYREEENVLKPLGTDYNLLIDNKNLQAEVDLFKSPFGASEQVLRCINLSICRIKKTVEGALTDKTLPRIIFIRKVTLEDDIIYSDDRIPTTIPENTDIPLTHFILDGQDFNLGWENNLIPNFSSEIEGVLQNTKVIKELIRLNSADINQLDFFTPIWLDKHNCYFYISQVQQYKMNRFDSTIVELVKLP